MPENDQGVTERYATVGGSRSCSQNMHGLQVKRAAIQFDLADPWVWSSFLGGMLPFLFASSGEGGGTSGRVCREEVRRQFREIKGS
jgi:Na+/H+-translocating membrane pyrophosphatase